MIRFNITSLLMLIFFFEILAQGNCLIYPDESGERRACELSYKAIEYPQGSIESQILFDSAIAIGPNYAWAYYQKSVPYFKRGLLAEAVQILNHAVQLEPQDYLCYRAYWYYQHRSYEACIRDLEMFYNLPNSYTSYNPGGDMDMRILLAVSYAIKGQFDKGIAVMEECISYNLRANFVGDYDHYVLGLLYFKNASYDKSIAEFKKQIKINSDFYDTYYYIAQSYLSLSDLKSSEYYMNEALLRMDLLRPGYTRKDLGYRIKKEEVVEKLAHLRS